MHFLGITKDFVGIRGKFKSKSSAICRREIVFLICSPPLLESSIWPPSPPHLFSTMLQCMTSWADHVLGMYAKSPTSMHPKALFQGTLPSVDDWSTDSFLWCTVPCLCLGAICIVLIFRRFLPMCYVMAICVIIGGRFACFSDHLHLASDYLREIDFADFELNVSSFHDLFNFAALVDWMEGISLYHPCILLSGLTHAWSIWIFAVCIFEYIIDFWA